MAAGSDHNQVGLLLFGVFVQGARGGAPCDRAVEAGPYEVGAPELARRGLIELFIQLLGELTSRNCSLERNAGPWKHDRDVKFRAVRFRQHVGQNQGVVGVRASIEADNHLPHGEVTHTSRSFRAIRERS